MFYRVFDEADPVLEFTRCSTEARSSFVAPGVKDRRLLTFCSRTPRHETSQDRRRRLSRPLIRIQEATGWHQVTPDGTADAELENRKGPGSQPARACALVTSATARRHPGGIARATLFLASGAPNIDTGSATIVSVIYRGGLSDSNSSMTRAA